MGGGWLGGLIGLVCGTLVLIVIVLLVVWAVRMSRHARMGGGMMGGHMMGGHMMPNAGAAGHDEAVAIAKKRLASGEIDKDAYDEIMKALNG
jgi:uncharacterized membrane protein